MPEEMTVKIIEGLKRAKDWDDDEEIKVNNIVVDPSLIKRYKKIKIPKKGGYRLLHIPPEELKKAQTAIHKFFKEIMDWDRFITIFGLTKGCYVGHANRHSKSRFIWQADIKDAFPSVTIDQLRRVILEEISKKPFEDFDIDIQMELFEKISEKAERRINDLGKLTEEIIKLTTYKNILPQGAPTSPFLFYLVLEEFFGKLYNACHPWKISMYVDNIVVSGNKPIPESLQKEITEIFKKAGFKLNKRKTRHQDTRNGAVRICGLMVDGTGRVILSKRTIKKWRGIICRACYNPKNKELAGKIDGFLSSLKPIYGRVDENLEDIGDALFPRDYVLKLEHIPPQIRKPLKKYLELANNGECFLFQVFDHIGVF